MVLVTILARDNDKPGNRELISFLKPNFAALVQSGLTFDLKIAEDRDIPDLIKKGLDKLPVAIIQGNNFTSSVEIKSILMKYLAARTAPRRSSKDPEDELRDFYSNEMSMEAVERDQEQFEEVESKKDVMVKYQDEMQRRQTEEVKRGSKPVPARTPAPRRPDNVAQRAPRETRMTGADPNNKDDALLINMMETSDEN